MTSYKVEAWDVIKDVRTKLGEFGENFETADKRYREAIKERKGIVKNTQYVQLLANGIVISEARIGK